jgi:hypothetical protein
MKQRHSHSAGPRLHLLATDHREPDGEHGASTASHGGNTPVCQEMVAVEIMKTPAIFTALTFRAAYVAARPELHTFARSE